MTIEHQEFINRKEILRKKYIEEGDNQALLEYMLMTEQKPERRKTD